MFHFFLFLSPSAVRLRLVRLSWVNFVKKLWYFFFFFLYETSLTFRFSFFLGLSASIRRLPWVSFVKKLIVSFYETLTNVSFLVFFLGLSASISIGLAWVSFAT